MNWAIVIPAGIGIAVLLSIAFVAIDVSGQISRQEEADEVRFYWDSMLRSGSTGTVCLCTPRESALMPRRTMRPKHFTRTARIFVRDVQSTTSAAAQRWFTRIARAETVIHGSV